MIDRFYGDLQDLAEIYTHPGVFPGPKFPGRNFFFRTEKSTGNFFSTGTTIVRPDFRAENYCQRNFFGPTRSAIFHF